MGKIRPRSTSLVRAWPLLLVLSSTLAAGHALSAAAPGDIDHADLATSSRFQGIGGPVTVTATVFIGSDPHRTLFVENLTIVLDFGTGFGLVGGENPVHIDSLPVQPSVNLFAATFAWVLNATAPGDTTLQLNVTSSSSGSAHAEALVKVRSGVVLGKTTLQPAAPKTSDPLSFTVAASSGFEDANISLNVSLCFFETTQTVRPLSATGNALRVWTADKSTRVETAPCFAMSGEGGIFQYQVPPRPRETLIYWVYAESNFSRVTSAPVRVFVEDPGTTAAVLWGTLGAVAAVTAGALYVMLYDPFGRKSAKGTLHNSPDRMRPSLIMLGLGIAVLALAVVLGAAVGLWRWFGYL